MQTSEDEEDPCGGQEGKGEPGADHRLVSGGAPVGNVLAEGGRECVEGGLGESGSGEDGAAADNNDGRGNGDTEDEEGGNAEGNLVEETQDPRRVAVPALAPKVDLGVGLEISQLRAPKTRRRPRCTHGNRNGETARSAQQGGDDDDVLGVDLASGDRLGLRQWSA